MNRLDNGDRFYSGATEIVRFGGCLKIVPTCGVLIASFVVKTEKTDFDRIDSGILFDEKSCLWKYIQSAIETNHVTKESTCIKLLNSTYVQNLRMLRVSDQSCHLKLFHIFQIKERHA